MGIVGEIQTLISNRKARIAEWDRQNGMLLEVMDRLNAGEPLDFIVEHKQRLHNCEPALALAPYPFNFDEFTYSLKPKRKLREYTYEEALAALMESKSGHIRSKTGMRMRINKIANTVNLDGAGSWLFMSEQNFPIPPSWLLDKGWKWESNQLACGVWE